MTSPPSERETPLIFSAPMVRALLDGRKTQTRRILKPQPENHLPGEGAKRARAFVLCRYDPGDRLWVREAWQDYCPMWGGAWCGHGDKDGIARDHQPVYRADPPELWLRGPPDKQATPLKWRSPIHMPRWASRITLEVTDVRVQRLAEVSAEDAVAEGVQERLVECADGEERNLWFGIPQCGHANAPREAFADLWDSIHNPRGYCADGAPHGWAANPWCAAISFRRVETPAVRPTPCGGT